MTADKGISMSSLSGKPAKYCDLPIRNVLTSIRKKKIQQKKTNCQEVRCQKYHSDHRISELQTVLSMCHQLHLYSNYCKCKILPEVAGKVTFSSFDNTYNFHPRLHQYLSHQRLIQRIQCLLKTHPSSFSVRIWCRSLFLPYLGIFALDFTF